jgi:hypothetical protein
MSKKKPGKTRDQGKKNTLQQKRKMAAAIKKVTGGAKKKKKSVTQPAPEASGQSK